MAFFACAKTYLVVLLVSDELGVLPLEDEDDGVLVEPLAAEPLGVELELDGVLLDEDEDEPPLALSFLFRSIDVDEELEPEGAVLGAAVVPLADEDVEPDGAVVAPDGEVVEDELERSAARSHAVISVAPSASETATARVETLMWPPWLGYWKTGANIGPRLLNHQRVWVSFSSSASCQSSADHWSPRSTGSRAAGWHASDRPAPASGLILRVSRRATVRRCSTMSSKIPQPPVERPTRCRFSATAS